LEFWNTFRLQLVFTGVPAWCWSDCGVFCAWLISGNATQLFCSVCYELGAILSLFVCIANVCICSMFLCVLYLYWNSEYLSYSKCTGFSPI
jgi:hypothetical protein